ncbi:MAG: hypothetical protein HY762_08970 [Planctomycetes bacterium]|nr:hypothetical protein [Planctomycetota bacterium]
MRNKERDGLVTAEPAPVKLIEDQKTIKSDVDELEAKMERISQKLAAIQPYYAEKLNSALAMVRQELLKDILTEVVNSLQQGLTGKSIANASEAEAVLKKVLAFLEDRIDPEEVKNKIDQLAKTLDKVGELQNKESEVNKELAQMNEQLKKDANRQPTEEEKRKSVEIPPLMAGLERLAKRQKEIEKETKELAEQAAKEGEPKANEGLKRAGKKMESASQNMSGSKPQEAKDDTDEAMDELKRVYEQLAQKMEDLSEKQQQQLMDKIDQMLTAIRDKQMDINSQTDFILGKAAASPADRGKELSREDIINLNKLSHAQNDLAAETESVRQKAKDDQSIVFSNILQSVKDDMGLSGQLLAERRLDLYTQDVQLDIIRKIDELLDALKKERSRKKPMQMMGNQKCNKMMRQLIPDIAELKMLKTMQENIKNRVEQFKGALPAEASVQAGLDSVGQMTLRRLSAQQGALSDMTKKLAKKLEDNNNMMPTPEEKER